MHATAASPTMAAAMPSPISNPLTRRTAEDGIGRGPAAPGAPAGRDTGPPVLVGGRAMAGAGEAAPAAVGGRDEAGLPATVTPTF